MNGRTANRDLVRSRSELPEHVLEAAIEIKALEFSAPTDAENCACCRSVDNGDTGYIHICEHYERLHEAHGAVFDIEESLTEKERGYLRKDRDLALAAWSARWDAKTVASSDPVWEIPEGHIIAHLWYALPDAYYAVPDPRAGVEEMTYWYRGVKGRKRLRSVFDPWPSKARYGPQFTWDDVPYERGTREAMHYIRALSEVLVKPYRHAIVEAVAEDPAAAAQRFATLSTRCCLCGRKLTNEESKVVGIGPECGKGIPKEVLANHFRTQTGQAHAARLSS